MALMRTSNPALSADAFRATGAGYGEPMTISGAVNKTGILLICAVATSIWSWNRFLDSPQTALPLLAIGGIGGFIVALVTIFKKEWSPMTAPLYALLEGLVMGSVSAMYEMRLHGIVIQAVGLTFGVLFALTGLPVRADPCHPKLQVGNSRSHRRHCAFLSGAVCPWFLRNPLCSRKWQRHNRRRLQPVCGRNCSPESSPGFRLHRTRCRSPGSQIYGVVRRVRVDGDFDLALSGDTKAPE